MVMQMLLNNGDFFIDIEYSRIVFAVVLWGGE